MTDTPLVADVKALLRKATCPEAIACAEMALRVALLHAPPEAREHLMKALANAMLGAERTKGDA